MMLDTHVLSGAFVSLLFAAYFLYGLIVGKVWLGMGLTAGRKASPVVFWSVQGFLGLSALIILIATLMSAF
jgi:hypothetical protein